jgi:hypothetical protein
MHDDERPGIDNTRSGDQGVILFGSMKVDIEAAGCIAETQEPVVIHDGPSNTDDPSHVRVVDEAQTRAPPSPGLVVPPPHVGQLGRQPRNRTNGLIPPGVGRAISFMKAKFPYSRVQLVLQYGRDSDRALAEEGVMRSELQRYFTENDWRETDRNVWSNVIINALFGASRNENFGVAVGSSAVTKASGRFYRELQSSTSDRTHRDLVMTREPLYLRVLDFVGLRH